MAPPTGLVKLTQKPCRHTASENCGKGQGKRHKGEDARGNVASVGGSTTGTRRSSLFGGRRNEEGDADGETHYWGSMITRLEKAGAPAAWP